MPIAIEVTVSRKPRAPAKSDNPGPEDTARFLDSWKGRATDDEPWWPPPVPVSSKARARASAQIDAATRAQREEAARTFLSEHATGSPEHDAWLFRVLIKILGYHQTTWRMEQLDDRAGPAPSRHRAVVRILRALLLALDMDDEIALGAQEQGAALYLRKHEGRRFGGDVETTPAQAIDYMVRSVANDLDNNESDESITQTIFGMPDRQPFKLRSVVPQLAAGRGATVRAAVLRAIRSVRREVDPMRPWEPLELATKIVRRALTAMGYPRDKAEEIGRKRSPRARRNKRTR